MNKKEALALARELAMAITPAEGGTSRSKQDGFYEWVVYGLDQDELDRLDRALDAAKAMGAETDEEALMLILDVFEKKG